MELLQGSINATKLAPVNLGELWIEAEKLGRIKVERNYRDDMYDVEIMFIRKSGTRVHAKAVGEDICFALGDCINEAREMGAG